MKKSEIKPMPEYFDRYINLLPDINLSFALQESLDVLEKLDTDLLKRIGSRVYAPGKWTVKDIIQHITDTERVFCYRSLRFARKDSTPTLSYDENMYAANAHAESRSIESLLEELILLRRGTICLFNSFTDEMLQSKGITWKYEMSVLAMGFTLAGHQKHHFKVMEEKYYSLV
jgi:hypothetical protein